MSCKILQFVVCSCIIIYGLAYATGGVMTGSGTTANPFLVEDYEDLKAVGIGTTYRLSSVYRLIADIDASPSKTEHGDSGFVPIGIDTTNKFTGNFHGSGYVIKNLFIRRPYVLGVGLFGYFNGTVDSLGLLNCSIFSYYPVGGIVGVCFQSGTLRTCYVTGSVSGSGDVGGIVGYNMRGTIINCFTTCKVSGGDPGGIVGYSIGTIMNCYATGPISGGPDIGGVVGINHGTVSNCYATGSVSGSQNNGGVAGANLGTMTYCYAAGAVSGNRNLGGIVGYNSSTGNTNYCYWDTNTTGLSWGCGLFDFGGTLSVFGLSTAQMKKVPSFVQWAFDTVWTLRTDSTYPGLRSIDNAPFAFADTLKSNRTLNLSRLLINDFDVETVQSHLMLKVQSTFFGTTDSFSIITYPPAVANGSVDTLIYRVGEIRPFKGDTLWGNVAKAFVTLDTTIITSLAPHRNQTEIYPLALYSVARPFSSYGVNISFYLSSNSFVSLKICDLRGREVATLINNERLTAGSYTRTWNTGAASGVYFCRLQAGSAMLTKKIWH
ncbi:MAG: T9SS type A sorting domain-containing protein [Chitinispirillaceae bacterium]|nr:T9SS type A sorting domain-containing protein [Chitinispirillaceae bacterium]